MSVSREELQDKITRSRNTPVLWYSSHHDIRSQDSEVNLPDLDDLLASHRDYPIILAYDWRP